MWQRTSIAGHRHHGGPAAVHRLAARSNEMKPKDTKNQFTHTKPPPSSPTGSPVEPHSLAKCLFLHLAPGIANIAATVLGLATFWNPSLPPELFFGVLANVFVLIPVQLGYLYYLAKKRRNPGWSLEGIVVYRQPISWSRYLLWVPAILVPTAIVFAALQPLTHWLETAFVGVSIFAKLPPRHRRALSGQLGQLFGVHLQAHREPVIYF